MKRYLLACLLASFFLPALAEEEGKTATSPELKAARKAYEEDRVRSIETANTRYIQKLRRLKETASGRNFELVKVIDAEIASFEFTKKLVEGKWLWFRNPKARQDKLRFTADGVMHHQYFKATWVEIAPWTVAIRLDGRIGYLVFDPEMQGFTGRDFDSSDKLAGKRDE